MSVRCVTHKLEFLTQAVTEVARLGKCMGIKQQALATAQVYIRRFYTKIEIRRTNPYLILATALYLACKMEESPHHIKYLVSEARSQWPGRFNKFYIYIEISDLYLQISSSPTSPEWVNANSS